MIEPWRRVGRWPTTQAPVAADHGARPGRRRTGARPFGPGRRKLTWCAPLVQASGAHRVEVRDGDPVDVLLAAAARERATLLVVGSLGVGKDPALALGSRASGSCRRACLPVLVVPERRTVASGRPDGLQLRHLLVGVDGSEPSLVALDLAADVAGMLGGSLSVLHVFERVPPFPIRPGGRASGGHEGGHDRALELLEDSACAIRRRGVGVQVVLRSGDPAPTLLELADDTDADLVVVGTRGRGGPGDLLLGERRPHGRRRGAAPDSRRSRGRRTRPLGRHRPPPRPAADKRVMPGTRPAGPTVGVGRDEGPRPGAEPGTSGPRELARPDMPIRVLVLPADTERYAELLHDVELWTHEPTVADLGGFAAEVEAADRLA
jgi:nucleotide-binding universal stress UspA family protein